MCRFARLRGLPVQHAGSRSGLGIRHPSSLRYPDRSIAVANVRSTAPVLANVRHESRLSSFLFNGFTGLAHFSNSASVQLVASPSRLDSRGLASNPDTTLDIEDVAMAVKTEAPDAKSVEILNEDAVLPTGQAEAALDPESDEDIPLEAEELKDALGRPPPVNSSYLPLPWKGRLGYVSFACVAWSNYLIADLSGLFEHIPAVLEPSCFLFPYMSHRIHPREPTPIGGP